MQYTLDHGKHVEIAFPEQKRFDATIPDAVVQILRLECDRIHFGDDYVASFNGARRSRTELFFVRLVVVDIDGVESMRCTASLSLIVSVTGFFLHMSSALR